VSQRRACQTVGQPRSTQRYLPRPRDDERSLVKRMRELSGKHPRYGYRRITALLRREGWAVNRKRVHRLWKREGLKVPSRQHKKRRWGTSDEGVIHRRAEHINHVWSYDFVMDETEDGRRLKVLPILDEYTRECLALEVERSITAQDVIAVLEYLFLVRGAPKFLRSDNGPEFIAEAVKAWLKPLHVKPAYIEPGSPWENAYSESFGSRLRDEFLNREVFANVREAKVLAEDYRRDYNEARPHSSLGYVAPAEFARACVASGSATLRLPQHTLSLAKTSSTLITCGT